jgi:hypothetical protein
MTVMNKYSGLQISLCPYVSKKERERPYVVECNITFALAIRIIDQLLQLFR